MNDICGQLFETPLATYDLTRSCWRMFGDTSVSDSPTFSPTLPVSGSMRNGQLFDHPMSEHPTDVRGSTSSQLLPTPTAQHSARNKTSGRKPGSKHHTGVTLADVAWMIKEETLGGGTTGQP